MKPTFDEFWSYQHGPVRSTRACAFYDTASGKPACRFVGMFHVKGTESLLQAFVFPVTILKFMQSITKPWAVITAAASSMSPYSRGTLDSPSRRCRVKFKGSLLGRGNPFHLRCEHDDPVAANPA